MSIGLYLLAVSPEDEFDKRIRRKRFKIVETVGRIHQRLKAIFFNQLTQSKQPLEKVLEVHKSELRKLLRPEQCEILYPPIGATNSNKYDVSLFYALLRVLMKIPRPKTGWYNYPLTTDQSVSAHVVRIHLSRNDLLHSRLKKTETDF